MLQVLINDFYKLYETRIKNQIDALQTEEKPAEEKTTEKNCRSNIINNQSLEFQATFRLKDMKYLDQIH